MTGFRVTKYDPARRLPDGTYPVDEWTGVGDIGRQYAGHVVTREEYLHVEDSYVEVVHAFMKTAGVRALTLTDLQVSEGRVTTLADEVDTHTTAITDGMVVAGAELSRAVRLALREAIWCRLEGAEGFYVHFGYDYYMYIGADVLEYPPALPSGMFAEEFDSPYFADEG